jgi:hypothetical protein
MITTSPVTFLEIVSATFQEIYPITTIGKVKNIALPFIKGFASIYLGIFGAVELKQCVKKSILKKTIFLKIEF